METFLARLGKITAIHTEAFSLHEPLTSVAAHFAHLQGTILLLSGGELDCARYHLLGIKPWLTLSARRRQCTIIDHKGRTQQFAGDPLDTLGQLLRWFEFSFSPPLAPVSAGLFGYLAYDLKDNLEELPRTSIDDLKLPHLYWVLPSILLIYDRQASQSHLCMPVFSSSTAETRRQAIADLKHTIQHRASTASEAPIRGGCRLRSNFSRTEYMAAVQRIKDYIAAGDVYQVNLSQRFETEFGGNPFDLFKTLYDINPAPFYAYIQAGDHTIVSTSPERFLQRIGPRVETRPIKGTRPRGYTAAEDRRMQKSLLESKKDDAELSMIVDLLRNDLGRACAAGTVQVQTHKRIEAYQNVYHLVSDVVGELDRGKDSVDLIKATFPGGSITGCPKIRSMEIIDELEPHRRHIYTGSIGYISFHQTMDLSIAIRTATVYDKKLFLSVGGGIVYDSDPADEYDETLHKGRTFTEVLKDQQNLPEKSNWVWINGQYKPAQEAQVPVSDLGLQYGYGFFETIRVSQGMAGHLEAHLNRFYNAWQRFFNLTPPDLTWQDIFLHLIRCNGLENQTAAVKLMATFGTPDTGRLHPTLIALARPYVHRLQDLNRSGLYLATYPEARQTPLADYKTMNYLYYFLAGKWARENGADEALVLNPDGNISETNTANIFLIKDKTVYRPASAHVLPGIMETEVLKLLENWDYRIEKRAMPSASLFTAEQVILTNALMGAVPVEKVDGRQTAKPNDLCERINRKLLI